MNELNANTSRRRRRSFGARSGLAAAVAAVLLLGLTACGKSQSPAASQPGSAAVSSAQPAEQPAAPEAPAESAPAPEQTPDGSGSSNGSSSAEKPTDENSNGADEPWKAEFEKSLLENYGVTPDHYEDLGGGVYQVYVEIDGRIVPYVAVDSATGDYHG